MKFYSKRLDGWSNPADVFISLYSRESNSFWLDREFHESQRFSCIGSGELLRATKWQEVSEFYSTLCQPHSEAETALPFSFRPGLVGFFDYELADIRLLAVTKSIVFDHEKRKMWFIGFFADDESFADWMHAALLRLALVGGEQAAYRHNNLSSGNTSEPVLRHDSEAYLQLIAKAQEHIEAGDVYQICLTNQIELTHEHDELSVFLELRKKNPAPYACYMKLGDHTLLSSSPEQFLSATAAGRLTTKPIKGTRGRLEDPEADSQVAAELKANAKERAENLMIVDLMRNDLAKVSEPKSVTVTKLFEVESYSAVHQLVSTVESQLAPGQTFLTALEAAFPGGSMTGAPKQRAIELLRGFEGQIRGVYSGIAGYLGFDGSGDFGMVIRSIIFVGNKATIGVGGGITSDSDPRAELLETQLKAKALLSALGAKDPWS